MCRFRKPSTATRHALLLVEVLNFNMTGEAQERLAALERGHEALGCLRNRSAQQPQSWHHFEADAQLP